MAESINTARTIPLPAAEVPTAETFYLTPEDLEWLEPLADKALDESWLTEANYLIRTGSLTFGRGSSENTSRRSEIVLARQNFFGAHMGWAEEGHPHNNVYRGLIKSKNNVLMPLGTFVSAQRTFLKNDIDNAKVLKANPGAVVKSAEFIKSHLRTLSELGFDASGLINQDPKLLSMKMEKIKIRVELLRTQGCPLTDIKGWHITQKEYSEAYSLKSIKVEMAEKRRKRRMRDIGRVAAIIGVEIDAETLVKKYPTLLNSSDERLLTYARLLTKVGSNNLTISEVGQMSKLPLETHIVTAMLGKEYKPGTIKAIAKVLPQAACAEIVQSMLQNERQRLEDTIGRKTVFAYEAYLEKKKT